MNNAKRSIYKTVIVLEKQDDGWRWTLRRDPPTVGPDVGFSGYANKDGALARAKKCAKDLKWKIERVETVGSPD